MLKILKIAIITLIISSIFTPTFSGTINYGGPYYTNNVIVNKLTHLGSHVRISFSNFAFPSSWGICLPDDVNLGLGWTCVIETSDPYYKDFLAMLMASKNDGKRLDIYWNCYTSYQIDTVNRLIKLIGVGLSQ